MGRLRFYSFIVTGRSAFPTDMLRYDRCWPGQERALPRHGLPPEADPYEVKVVGVLPPRVLRWKSFGWTVGEVSQEYRNYPTKKDLHQCVSAAIEALKSNDPARALQLLQDRDPRDK